MLSDLPTTIFVPNGDDDNAFEDDTVCSDDDDLSLTREMVRSHCRAAPERRLAPPRTVSLESHHRQTPRRSISTSSDARRAPLRTVSASDSFLCRSPVHLMRTDSYHHHLTNVRQVSPTSNPREISIGEPSASSSLDVLYREGLKKLARSMKHSDMTRSVIKRTSSKFTYRSGSVASGRSSDFFISPRCDEVEQCRRQLFDMIVKESL